MKVVSTLLTLYRKGWIRQGGWFYSLHAISALIKGSVAFKNVVSTGLVLDKNGVKMSKRLGNTIDPFEAIGQYGADAVRWYMISNAQPWDNLKFDLAGVEEVRRKFFGTLYNTYSFLRFTRILMALIIRSHTSLWMKGKR